MSICTFHTEYSVLDGASKMSELLDRCKDYGMRACAVTDHGCLFGALEFYQQAHKAGIKPIIGSELYVSPHQPVRQVRQVLRRRLRPPSSVVRERDRLP